VWEGMGRGGKEWVSVGRVDITTKRTGPYIDTKDDLDIPV